VPRRMIPAGETLIREAEGCRLESYRCSAGVPTIGVGETGPDIRMGMTWTAEYAEERFQKRLRIVEGQVEKLLLGARVPDSVFAAVCSLVFNLGPAAIERSTLLRKLRKGDLTGAFSEIPRWCHAGGVLIPGLVLRRKREQDLWNQYKYQRRQ
jgi:lysozyme